MYSRYHRRFTSARDCATKADREITPFVLLGGYFATTSFLALLDH